VENLGYTKRVHGVGTSMAATQMFQVGCVYDCGRIRFITCSL